METSLHRQLKLLYAGSDGVVEHRVGRYRVDAVADDVLIEIQHSGLAAIRDKIRALLATHQVLVVVPIVARKLIVSHAREDGPITARRRSPKRGRALDLFDQLVHFTAVFPHPRLRLETPLVEIEEHRYPGHGRRRRRRARDFVISDQCLSSIVETKRYTTSRDLLGACIPQLPREFDSAVLADTLSTRRATARRIAYCLRETGAVRVAGKRGNTLIYARSA